MSLQPANTGDTPAVYDAALTDVAGILDAARRSAARSVNSIMTAAYWLVGRRIVEYEQGGAERAGYGAELIRRLSVDLTASYGRGFSPRNLRQMRAFYLAWPIQQTLSGERVPEIWQTASTERVPEIGQIASAERVPEIGQTASAERVPEIGQTASAERVPEIWQTASAERVPEILPTASAELAVQTIAPHFPLPWSAYVLLLSVESQQAREFYETEALAGGGTVRQLKRQIDSQFYERTALSRNKEAMLLRGRQPEPGDLTAPEMEFKDPYLLEFLGLKDEYSESDLEEALIQHLETFLMELGSDFCFVGRQRRLRVGDEWYRVDLLFYNRRLRCPVVIDLKLGRFTHADAGQMNLYLNYAREHWTLDGENPPVGLILCSQRDETVAHYALAGLDNTILQAEYRTALPAEETLTAEINRAREMLRRRGDTTAPAKGV